MIRFAILLLPLVLGTAACSKKEPAPAARPTTVDNEVAEEPDDDATPMPEDDADDADDADDDMPDMEPDEADEDELE